MKYKLFFFFYRCTNFKMAGHKKFGCKPKSGAQKRKENKIRIKSFKKNTTKLDNFFQLEKVTSDESINQHRMKKVEKCNNKINVCSNNAVEAETTKNFTATGNDKDKIITEINWDHNVEANDKREKDVQDVNDVHLRNSNTSDNDEIFSHNAEAYNREEMITEINCDQSVEVNDKMEKGAEDANDIHLRDTDIADNDVVLNHNTKEYSGDKIMTEVNCDHSAKANYEMENDVQDISYNHLRDSNTSDNDVILNHNAEAYNEDKVTDSELYKSFNTDDTIANDLGLWPEKITEDILTFWMKVGSESCSNMDASFEKSIQYDGKQKRYFSKSLFYRSFSNGEKKTRSWLCYSPTTGKVFCFNCKLLSDDVNAFSMHGFSDWKNATQRITSHENSQSHRNAVITFCKRSQGIGCIDNLINHQYQSECFYMTEILRRVVATIKHLGERGLAFRGHDEILGSPHNGNFLGFIELLAQFDSLLSAHIKKYGNKGKGSVSYLSSTICDEFIDILGGNVLDRIIAEIQEAKYFSISLDSTPDISHVDRLTCIFRYVTDSGPIERFVQFLNMKGHSAQEIAQSLLQFLKIKKIDIANCRGQSYDNASNMSGKNTMGYKPKYVKSIQTRNISLVLHIR